MQTKLGLAALILAAAAVFPLPAAPEQNPELASVAIEKAKNQIDFLAGKALVGRYNIGPDVAKPYLWPLVGPGGTPLTRAWPMDKPTPGGSTDHVHQKSAWFCHGDIIPEGLEIKDKIKGIEGIDFWSEAKGHGRIVVTSVDDAKQEKNHGQLTTHNSWQMADGTPVLEETRTIHLYNFGDTQLFVFDIDLLASAAALTFGDTKEGSMGVRVNDQITEKSGHGKIENADGKVGEADCWGQLSKWCDYSGPLPVLTGGFGDKKGGVGHFEARVVGLAIFDDPNNRYPACWHSRGYGLMAANPFGRSKSGFPALKGKTELVKLAKGDHLKLRYGLLIHPGDAKEGKVAEYFEKFTKLKG